MALTPKSATAAITLPATSGPGSSTEVINLTFDYCHDFNGDGFHDVKVTASIDTDSRSPSTGTMEDLLGLAFDLNGETLGNLQIQDISIVDYQDPTGNNEQYTPNYIIEQDGIGDGKDPDPDFNIEGGALGGRVRDFDASVQFSGGGASDGTVQEANFIISSSAGDIDAADLLGGTSWYARLQSTDGGDDSSKMYLDALGVALFEPCEDEPPPPEEYQGLTPGYWKTHGPAPENSPGGQDNDWDNDSITGEARPVHGASALKYDKLIFGGLAEDIRWKVAPSSETEDLDDLSVSQALSAKGGGKYELARHSMAAILNARDEDVNYFASESDICSWTAAALIGNQVQVGTMSYDLHGLANLFKTNNELGLEPSLVAI